MTAYDAPLALAEFEALCIKANHLLRTIRTAKDEKTAKEFLSKTRTLAGQSKWTLDEVTGVRTAPVFNECPGISVCPVCNKRVWCKRGNDLKEKPVMTPNERGEHQEKK